jgi:hypothetical protein
LQANAKFLGLELTPVNGVQAASFSTPRQRQRPQLSFDEDAMLSAAHATDVDSIMAGKSYLLRVSYAVHSDKGCTYDPQGTGWRNLFVRDATDYDSPESYIALLCDNTYPEPFTLRADETAALLHACASSMEAPESIIDDACTKGWPPIPWLCYSVNWENHAD